MSVSTIFKPSIRDAGNISDYKIYGSLKTAGKFDAPIPKGKYEDLFVSKEFESAVMGGILPKEENQSKEKSNDKKIDDENEEREEDYVKNKLRRKNDEKQRSKNRKRSDEKEKPVKDGSLDRRRNKETNNESNNEDEFFKSLEEKRERRRRKLRDLEENIKNEENEKENKEKKRNSESSKRNEKNESETEKQQKPSKKEKVNNNREANLDGENIERGESRKHESIRLNSASNKRQPIKEAFGEKKADSAESDNGGGGGDEEVRVDIGKTKTAKIQRIDPDNNYFKLIKKSNTMDFLLTQAPQGQMVNCKIIFRRGILNEYFFYLEDYSGGDLLLIKTSRKISMAKACFNIIALNYDESVKKVVNETNCGLIESNMSRKKFKLRPNLLTLQQRDILDISLKSNIGEPRRLVANASMCTGISATSAEHNRVTYVLKNKQPTYDIYKRRFVLNFDGRARLSSKHNYQIVDEYSPDEIIMQLGKVDIGEFSCDYSFPLCALQAFGLALSSFTR